MSPKKKHPRPVTRWVTHHGDGSLGILATTVRKVGDIRCRVVPIRKDTDAENERLAKALWKMMPKDTVWQPWERTSVTTRSTVRLLARAAWRKGARP